MISTFAYVRWSTQCPTRGWQATARGPALHFRLAGLLTVICMLAMIGAAGAAGQKGRQKAGFKLEATAFAPGGEIPKRFTCDGPDASPALTWTDPPAGTQSFALIADDPDAPVGTWVHWVVFDLPASARQLPESVPKDADLRGGGRQGVTDFQRIGYGGPCPPKGKPHRYFFKLYALDKKLNLKSTATKKDVEQAMPGHILAQAELMGRYGRR